MSGSKGRPRNKFKQIIQIEGQPEQIFKPYEGHYISIIGNVNGKDVSVKLGKIGPTKQKMLEKMFIGTSLKVVCETKSDARHVHLSGAQSVKTTKEYTLIEVLGSNEEEKNIKVEKVMSNLKNLGVKFQKRCEWVCSVDNKYVNNEGKNKEINKELNKELISSEVIKSDNRKLNIIESYDVELKNKNYELIGKKKNERDEEKNDGEKEKNDGEKEKNEGEEEKNEIREKPTYKINPDMCKTCESGDKIIETYCNYCFNGSRFYVKSLKKEVKELTMKLGL